MKAVLRIMVFGVFTVSLLSSCKVYRNVENLSPKVTREEKSGLLGLSSLEKLEQGDKILVNTSDGKSISLLYISHNDNELEGTVTKIDGKKVEEPATMKVPIESIDKLYVRRFSAGATIPTVLVSVFAIVVAVFAIGLSSSGAWW